VHLLAAMEHATRAVLAQRQVGGAPEEVTAFAPLLAPLDLAEVVITTDALQTPPEAPEFVVANEHAHYLFVVKANQPALLDRCQRLAWHRVPVLDRIWSSGCSVGRGRSTSPLRYAATPATHADPSPPSGSASNEPDITTERRSPGVCRGVS
jgi:hypothetical protein